MIATAGGGIDSAFLGKIIGVVFYAGGYLPVVEIASREACYCLTLVQDGGADGDASSPATWTYSVLDVSRTQVIATHVIPVGQRVGGTIYATSPGKITPATWGIVCFLDNSLAPFIVMLNETPNFSAYTAVTAVNFGAASATTMRILSPV
jgi:hypothetical protein